jgi:hypothetical protein
MNTSTTEVSGLQILKACRYDFELCGAIIALRDDWEELLQSIEAPQLRRNVAAIVGQIRPALGLGEIPNTWWRE